LKHTPGFYTIDQSLYILGQFRDLMRGVSMQRPVDIALHQKPVRADGLNEMRNDSHCAGQRLGGCLRRVDCSGSTPPAGSRCGSTAITESVRQLGACALWGVSDDDRQRSIGFVSNSMRRKQTQATVLSTIGGGTFGNSYSKTAVGVDV
jgi:hypothetical protein